MAYLWGMPWTNPWMNHIKHATIQDWHWQRRLDMEPTIRLILKAFAKFPETNSRARVGIWDIGTSWILYDVTSRSFVPLQTAVRLMV